ncbi:MAG: hypothetical protein F4087_13985, partial [Gemmatimonadetes bacterium]|nr:hypothetical protein [Gemmatimonadota bacterium]
MAPDFDAAEVDGDVALGDACSTGCGRLVPERYPRLGETPVQRGKPGRVRVRHHDRALREAAPLQPLAAHADEGRRARRRSQRDALALREDRERFGKEDGSRAEGGDGGGVPH